MEIAVPKGAHLIYNGEFYAHMKEPSRVRDLTTGELLYRWSEMGQWTIAVLRMRSTAWTVRFGSRLER